MTAKTISIIAITLAGIAYYSYRHDVIALDGLSGEFLLLIAKPETRYARHYTNRNFAKVQRGMTEQEVVKLLSKPLYRDSMFYDTAQYVRLQYSESPSSTHYRLRQVYLDNGKVAEVVAYFYID